VSQQPEKENPAGDSHPVDVPEREYQPEPGWRLRTLKDWLRYGADDFRRYRARWNGVRGWLTDAEAAWLFDAARRPTVAGDIVEIGSAYGRSTVCLAWGVRRCGQGHVWAVDPHTGGRKFRDKLGQAAGQFTSLDGFRANLRRFGLQSLVTPVVKTSEQALRDWEGRPIRLLFVDGWHTYEAVRADIAGWGRLVVSGGWIAAHDYQQEAVQRAMADALVDLGLPAGTPLQRAGNIAAFAR